MSRLYIHRLYVLITILDHHVLKNAQYPDPRRFGACLNGVRDVLSCLPQDGNGSPRWRFCPLHQVATQRR